MKIRHLGRLQLKTDGDSAAGELQVHEVWPQDGVLQTNSQLIKNFLGKRDLVDLDHELASVVVTYSMNGRKITEMAAQKADVLPKGSYMWCPVLPDLSPWELESYISENPPIWEGTSVTVEQDLAIAAISGQSLVTGLALKPKGKMWQIAVEPQLLQKIYIDPAWCIKEKTGWFVPRLLLAHRRQSEVVREPVGTLKVQSAQVPMPLPAPSEPEAGFEGFLTVVADLGLHYHRDDLVLVYSGIAAGQFVVLEGAAGMGKSRLMAATARFLECGRGHKPLVVRTRGGWVGC
jgi:hypothetical protein